MLCVCVCLKTTNTKYPGNLEYFEKTNLTDNRVGGATKVKGTENIFNKIIKENLPNLNRGAFIKI